jgi:hypothetical protein
MSDYDGHMLDMREKLFKEMELRDYLLPPEYKDADPVDALIYLLEKLITEEGWDNN